MEDSQLQVDCISITARTEKPGQWQKSKASGDDHKSAPGRAKHQRESVGEFNSNEEHFIAGVKKFTL